MFKTKGGDKHFIFKLKNYIIFYTNHLQV